MAFLPPLTSVVLRPKTIADREKMDIAMAKLAPHDPPFAVDTGPDAEHVVITAVDDLHLKIVIDRLMRGFTIEANLGNPQVIYRETILRQSEAEGKYIRQTGGSGNY